jgi:pimeloyl-ACP methyl ester carboxylesterase
MQLYCETHGSGQPVLVLLHGMGANGAVWQRFLEVLSWRGKVLVPDLRGHGRSPHGRHYGYGQHAADVAELLEREDDVCIVGHSMGGAVALALASGSFGVDVKAVLAFGTKTGFAADELKKMEALARSPVRWFDSRAEAAARFLKVAGLEGLLGPDSAAAIAGVREEGGRYRLAADPASVTAAWGPPLASLLKGIRARVVVATGSNDRMVPIADLTRIAPDAIELPGIGHNLHVEAPAALLPHLEPLAA